MKNNDKVSFLEQHGFEARPGAGRRCYPYLVIDHNQNSDKLYFNNVDQAYEIIRQWYVPKESRKTEGFCDISKVRALVPFRVTQPSFCIYAAF